MITKGTHLVITLNETTEGQLEVVKQCLEKYYFQVHDEVLKYQNLDDVPGELIAEWDALQNICADLEIEGFMV